MKKTKRRAKRDKEGSEPLLLKYLIPHSLSFGFQATSSIPFKVYLNGVRVCVCVYVCVCVCGGGGKEKRNRERNVEGIRCYDLTICCLANIYLFHSKFIAEISIPNVTVFSGGAFSNSSKNRRKEHFQIHFLKPTLVWYQSQIRTPWEKKIAG